MVESPQPALPVPDERTPLVSRVFDLGVLAAGVFSVLFAVFTMGRPDLLGHGLALLAVPLIMTIARFPLVLDKGNGGLEVGFDSCVLMFLLCSLPPQESLLLWSLGVLGFQLTNGKRRMVRVFNYGVGTLGGASAALMVAMLAPERGSLRELLAITLAATTYFFVDFVVSAISLSLEESSPIAEHLRQRNTLIAVACFVPFDSLGYLGAIVAAETPWWTLVLLGVPLVTLLIATRSVTRGNENSRRLAVLFDAAVRAQTLSDNRQVLDALIDDSERLLRMAQVEVRQLPPAAHEIGAPLQDGLRDRWLVAPARHRARSTQAADQQALEALVAVSSDAFARLRLTDDMTHLARHDLLTNLPNRGLVLDRVEHALQLSRRRGTQIALLFVDLDGFKQVNDRFGHAAGDAVLIDFAERLTTCVRQSDTVARLGGDEFAILLEDVRAAEVDSACHRILAALSSGAHVAGHTLTLSASIGVAFGERRDTSESMLRNADLAMYEAKSRGKNQFVVYEGALGQTRLQRLELVESLRASVGAGDLRLVYQPVVHALSGRITGVEALARWRSNGVDVSPDVFIKVAEESGLVVALGDVVLDIAARDCAELVAASGGDLNIAVNISAKQLREPDFVQKVEETQARMAGASLVLEITERDMVGDDAVSTEVMTSIADLGVALAIDDFGVGFSSIGYLQDMPVRIIKADGSFSDGIDRDERACALLCSITMMGQALGLDVVVEGIERPEQLEHLREHVHAPYAQGYLMYRPMALDAVVEALRENRTRVAAEAVGQRPPSGTSSMTSSTT
ncbi:putative bifunctional diguanylate cyclase/phosphodiesterase [Nocardioides mesophilus]|uniref:EAL domain-containing protein n=1 Tax=Nocardioides mesophilus TaxID=433659 RepID=A0A7G9RB99_9ACTN|nr:EAL domain-containing protein [Nocardioides mesophilus]QNN52874.1 EAL domain-containing protein [Nocardioides mesophilus]